MKTYTFIATIAITLLLTSCSSDSDETTFTTNNPTKNFDSLDSFAREDTIVEGEPAKPKGKD